MKGARAGAAALAFALLTLAGLCWGMRHLPPLGTDGLIYHLPLAVWWLQEGWLAPVDLPFHGGGSEHQPALAQTVSLLLLRLAGDDRLCWLVQPACLLALAAVYLRSARLLGAGRPLARGLAALLLLFTPHLMNVQLPNNDLSFLLGAALALHGLLLLRRRPGRGALITGLGLGLALAVKSTGTLVLVPLLPLLAAGLLAAWRRAPPGPRRAALLRGAGAGAALLLLGSGFLVRNLLVHGNPLWPGRLRLLGLTLFEGPYDLSVLVDHHWAPGVIGGLLWDGYEQHSLGLPWSPLLWAGWGLSCLALARASARRRAPLRSAVVLGFAPLHFLLVFSQVPFWSEPRYHLPTYYGLWLGLALGLAELARRERARLAPWLPLLPPLFLGLLCLLAGEAAPLPLLGAAAAAVSAGHPLLRQARRRARPLLAGAALLGLVALALSGPSWSAERAARRGDLYARYYGVEGAAWARLDEERAPTTIAYAGTPHVYPLFGPRLQHRVVYLRLSAEDRVAPLSLANRPADVIPGYWMHESIARARRARVDDAYWLAELDRLRPRWLLLVEVPHRGGVAQERGLIARHPARFRLEGHARDPAPDGRGMWLYRVLDPP